MHVESEVVLKCERNNNEGACDMLCKIWRMSFLWDSNESCWLDNASPEPREKNHVCGSATYAWVWCSVYNTKGSFAFRQGSNFSIKMFSKRICGFFVRKGACSISIKSQWYQSLSSRSANTPACTLSISRTLHPTTHFYSCNRTVCWRNRVKLW